MSLFRIICLLLVGSCLACNSNQSGKDQTPVKSKSNSTDTKAHRKVIAILPFGDFPDNRAKDVRDSLLPIFSTTTLLPHREFPKESWYAPRKRYRADKLIDIMRSWTSKDTVLIGLSEKDISHTKGNTYDYGIMGLGFCPGNACVVSTHRLNQTKLRSQFFKLALHELGHTQGLPHCADLKCLMRDAKGKNHFDELKSYCFNCRAVMIKKGWKVA